MISLVRSWLLLVSVFLCYGSIARAQHMNSADAPCRNIAVTLAMENCFDKAYRAADSALNQKYSQISKVLQPDDQQRLEVAQHLRISFETRPLRQRATSTTVELRRLRPIQLALKK